MSTDLTRRRLLQAMAALPLVGVPNVRAATHIRKSIPSSGEKIPAIGLGTSRVFDVGSSKSEREGPLGALKVLSEVGNAMVDTSPMYGAAEGVVGDLATQLGVRDKLFYATKVWTHGREDGIRQMEDSFRLLRTDRIDLMQVHNLVDTDTHLKTLRAWKEQGRIRYIGITHYHEGAHDDLAAVMRREKLDFVQLNYSLVEPQAAEKLLPLAQDRGIAVIVNRPFARGQLFGLTRGKALPGWASEYGIDTWAKFFLKWVISHPAVTVAIPGTGSAEHMADNVGAGMGPLPDAKRRAQMFELITKL